MNFQKSIVFFGPRKMVFSNFKTNETLADFLKLKFPIILLGKFVSGCNEFLLCKETVIIITQFYVNGAKSDKREAI